LRILIADDNEMVRRGIALLLSQESGWSVCGEATNSDEVLNRAEALRPELVLLDVSMPGIDGLQVTHRLKHRLPHTQFIIISQHDPHQLRPLALEAGAAECIDKARLATDLLPAIRKIAAQKPGSGGTDGGSNGAPGLNHAAR
jgi:DNA-binding NarL/FixJ family response regulator